MTSYLFKHKYKLCAAIFMISLASLLDIYLAFIFKSLIYSVISQAEKQFISVALIALSFIIVSSFIKLLSHLLQASYLRKTMLFFKESVFQHILYKSHTQFTSSHSQNTFQS
ncbi:ATP-binding cassette subfamily C protein [Paenibacillus brasilensis]|uniref:ATP-binding cassette subfamily C protein n=1 Tax=Paenibacillus brasilensis TaxID=128574 RepID=A0ABU0KYL9_9BACL|nr:ATP-binding cassette subfamily C protein [Paenibacillus brasilensis]